MGLTIPAKIMADEERTWCAFGDILAVDWDAPNLVDRQSAARNNLTDERRWLVLQPARGASNRPWLLLSLGTGAISFWPSLVGWRRVEVNRDIR